MHKLFRLVWQSAILWAIYRGGSWLVAETGLPLPANVVGVLALFGLLCLGVVKLEHVEEAADFLLRHLVFFFVPITVGLMEWGDVFSRHWAVLLLAVLASSLTPFWLVGFATQWLHHRRRPCDI